ncbi:TauD/TfdA family dioxygenase [Pigmentiphaga soli]|uniref:TauD/TfdA family dioxygenase n=1 Tax=Pigmentiphaga soli TaxID=1007095 RepID=A0ABP8GKG1_9BURK
MGNFRSFGTSKREPAYPMAPVVDPAGWTPETLPPLESWSYRLSDRDCAEIVEATEDALRRGIPPEAVCTSNFRLGGFGEVLRDVRRELVDGRGMVMLRGFPVDRLDRLGQAVAYLGIGDHLGRRTSQNAKGHLIAHVKDTGANYADLNVRSYQTNAGLVLHSDACTHVGLLCLRTAKSGGQSMVASSVTVYNRMLERRPDLVEELAKDFYRSKAGEVNPGEQPFYKLPIFTFYKGYFSAVGAGAFIDKAQALPGVPPLTPIQKEAIRLYRETAVECSIDIPFAPGDIQFLNNCVTLHARRSYEDWPDPARKRHLLRLWLSDPDARPLPPEQFQGYVGSGVLLDGVTPNVSLDVAEYAE